MSSFHSVIFDRIFPTWRVSGVGLRKIKRATKEEDNRGPVQERGIGFNLQNGLRTMGSKSLELDRMLIAKKKNNIADCCSETT